MSVKPCFTGMILWMLMSTPVWSQLTAPSDEGFKPTLMISGYVQFRGVFGEGVEDEFRIPRGRVTFSGKVAPTVSYKLMADLADLNGTPLRDGFVEVALPSGQLRLGQFKTPMTAEYLTSSSRLDVINRTQVVNNLAPKRDLGIQYRGTFPQGEFQVAVINGEGVNTREENDQKDVLGRVVFNPVPGAHLGVSYLTGRKGPDSVDRQRTGLEARYRDPRIDAWAEFLRGEDDGVDQEGWFLLVARPANPEQPLRPFIRYEQFDPDDATPGDGEDILTLGATWFHTPNAKVILNYERHDPQTGSVENVFLFQGQIRYK